MDPNETLKRIRKQLHIAHNTGDRLSYANALEPAVELIESLDEWLSKGGFLPDDWRDR